MSAEQEEDKGINVNNNYVEKNRSDSIYDLLESLSQRSSSKKRDLRNRGELAPCTKILVNDLETSLTAIQNTSPNHFGLPLLRSIIDKAKKEEFHDFYASEDSEGDTKDVYELVIMLGSVKHAETDKIAQWAREDGIMESFYLPTNMAVNLKPVPKSGKIDVEWVGGAGVGANWYIDGPFSLIGAQNVELAKVEIGQQMKLTIKKPDSFLLMTTWLEDGHWGLRQVQLFFPAVGIATGNKQQPNIEFIIYDNKTV